VQPLGNWLKRRLPSHSRTNISTQLSLSIVLTTKKHSSLENVV
jgi:hypothetical protein